jgi:YfiH family protein
MPSPNGWSLRSADGVQYYELLRERARLVFVTRQGGVSDTPYESLNLSFDTGDDIGRVSENWARLRVALRSRPVVTMRQVHSDTVLPIMYDRTPAELLDGDASYTSEAGPALGVKVADCLPVYVFAADRRCFGIAHCGWRGTAARLAEKLCRAMSRRFGVTLTDLRFALGPCICPDCYTVGEDVWRAMRSGFPIADKLLVPAEGRARRTWHLDLRSANRWLLQGMGLVEVASLDVCTREESALFFSARRDGTTGRNLAAIMVA